MRIPFATLGQPIAEVTNITRHGIWLYWAEREFFLPYERYSWFRNAKVKDILNVRLESPNISTGPSWT